MNNKQIIYQILLLATLVCSCGVEKKQADLLIFNANIYTVDSAFRQCEAMVIKDGKIMATGSNSYIRENWQAGKDMDLQGGTVVPGLIDAHCHFLAYGLGLTRVDLTGTSSFAEVLQRVEASARSNRKTADARPQDLATIEKRWIIGRGWDQNDWTNKEMPDNHQLDSLFPEQPVYLTRIDGHAVLVNSKALQMAGITATTKISGGEIILRQNQPSGVLIDNAIELVRKIIPQASLNEKTEALLNAQENCLAVGLTTVDDAGLMSADVDLIQSLQKDERLKMRVYAMLSDSAVNYDTWLKRGPLFSDKLTVSAFKFYADGALGSRGACLYKNYDDKKDWKGFLLSEAEHFEKYARLLADKGFQVNTHCIGDSAFGLITSVYSKYCRGDGSRRWRIEHAQVTSVADVSKLNKDIIPSVQPTHATSDMYWAADRLGTDRVKTAYAYKQLMQKSGLVALGTDFPVEDISPFKTFHAAVFRQDDKNYPEAGFQRENALSPQETLRGMTIWAAYANFEEKIKGSLEAGKVADFVILDRDLLKCKGPEVLQTKVLATYIGGQKVFGK